MKRLILVFIFFSITYEYCIAQNDNLIPFEDSTFHKIISNERSNISKLLLFGLSDSPEIRFTVLPSIFISKYVLSLEKDTGQFYKLIYQSCAELEKFDKKFNVSIRKTVFKKSIINIDSSFANAIKKLFVKVIQQAKIPQKEVLGLDGVTYFFSAKISNDEIITGTIWSPSKRSKMQKLISICHKLIAHARYMRKNVSRLKNEINQFCKTLE